MRTREAVRGGEGEGGHLALCAFSARVEAGRQAVAVGGIGGILLFLPALRVLCVVGLS